MVQIGYADRDLVLDEQMEEGVAGANYELSDLQASEQPFESFRNTDFQC
jgi:hypothetical protein